MYHCKEISPDFITERFYNEGVGSEQKCLLILNPYPEPFVFLARPKPNTTVPLCKSLETGFAYQKFIFVLIKKV